MSPMLLPLKKGQAAAGAAILLVIILGLLIGFIVLVPPAERVELLGENESTGTTASDGTKVTSAEENLLSVSPGRIDYLAQKEMEHPLPTVNIFTRTESKVLAEKNLAYAKKAAFSEEVSEFRFSLPNLADTKEALLSFKVKDKTKGRLLISLNGERLYNAEPQLGSNEPTTLPQNFLKTENTIQFAVSSPGMAFWSTNDITLEDIRLIAEVTRREAQLSRNTFLVSETEKKNLEKVVLKFQPECRIEEVDVLSILINGNEIYNAVPECELALVPIEFSPALINQGENEIVFKTEKGVYLLSHVLIESKLAEIEFPTYYFELSQEQYDAVKNEKKRIRLELDFVDVTASKFGDIVFNGNLRHFDTKEVSYTLDLSADIVRGNNALKLKPKKTLEVRELKVDLVK